MQRGIQNVSALLINYLEVIIMSEGQPKTWENLPT